MDQLVKNPQTRKNLHEKQRKKLKEEKYLEKRKLKGKEKLELKKELLKEKLGEVSLRDERLLQKSENLLENVR